MNRRSGDLNWKKVALILAIIVIVWLMLGCSKGNTRIEYVEKKVPVQATLDPRLTTPPKFPAPPPFACRDHKNRATVCETDHQNYDDAVEKALKDAIKKIEEIAGLQQP